LIGCLLNTNVEIRSSIESDVEIVDPDYDVFTGHVFLVINDSIQNVAGRFCAEISVWVEGNLLALEPSQLPVLSWIEAHGWSVIGSVAITHHIGLITVLLDRVGSFVFTGMMETDAVSDLVHLR